MIYAACVKTSPLPSPPAAAGEPAAPAVEEERRPAARPEELAAPATRAIEIEDEILAMAPLEGRPGRLVLLGRRTLVVYELGPGELGLVDRIDLTDHIPGDARLPRRGAGYVGTEGPDRLRIWSTVLGGGGVALRLDGNRLVPDGVGDGPSRAAEEEERRGWPGRVITLASRGGAPTLFHLDDPGRLVASTAAGESLDVIGPIGEPLAAQDRSGLRGTLFTSSPSLPGEPDRVLEFRWNGSSLRAERQSRPFNGRIAALTVLDRGRRIAIATVDRPGRSRLQVLERDDFWGEGAS